VIADIFVDCFGALVDARLSETRDMAAAMTLFRSAKAVTGIMPTWVTTDGHDSDQASPSARRFPDQRRPAGVVPLCRHRWSVTPSISRQES
jgi:hypothetical protein